MNCIRYNDFYYELSKVHFDIQSKMINIEFRKLIYYFHTTNHFMKNLGNVVIFISLLFLLSCNGGGSSNSHVSKNTIPVLKTEKSKKAKLSFNLTEVIKNKNSLDFVIVITNKSTEAKVFYNKKELAITDNNGYIYKVEKAQIDGVKQFGGMKIASIPEFSKVKSIITFSNIRDDAETAQLFFKGEVNRGKNSNFKITFKDIPITKKE